jgi:hypothetical protein
MPRLEPDSLAIVTQEFRSNLDQYLRSHLVRYKWNFVEFKVLISGEDGAQKGRNDVWKFLDWGSRVDQ